MRRGLLATLACGVLLFALAEAAVRLGGLVAFPLYRADPFVGYIPQPNQRGRFLRRNAWVFNDRSMGVAAPFRPTPDGVLLLGDSLVLGGDPLNQPDKLGPRLQDVLRLPVWPISAGSWALQNEMAELKTNPDFLKLGTIVVVSNSEDFGAPSVWRSQLFHPTKRPVSALLYLAVKYVFAPQEPRDAPSTPAAQAVWSESVRRFLASYRGRVLWVIYPMRLEVGHTAEAFRPLLSLIKERVEVLELANEPRWNKMLYRDRMHPDQAGARVLAQIIAERLHTPASQTRWPLVSAAAPR